MQFSDIYLNAEEFFEILREAWEKSEFFDGWDRRWHPEDIASNLEVVFDGVTQGIVSYSHLIGKNSRKSMPPYDPNKKRKEDMTDKNHESKSKWTAYNSMEYADLPSNSPTYPDVFGDNV